MPEDPATALALERLRGVVGESFAEIKGSLALLVQRNDQNDRELGQHRIELVDHDRRLGEVERALAVLTQREVVQEQHETKSTELKRWLIGTAAAFLLVAVTAAASLLTAH
jgi:hypothetical protein